MSAVISIFTSLKTETEITLYAGEQTSAWITFGLFVFLLTGKDSILSENEKDVDNHVYIQANASSFTLPDTLSWTSSCDMFGMI